jgi:hypothetical protein
MAKTPETHAWQDIEEQAFHAYREWPLWLVLRNCELQAHQSGTNPTVATQINDPSATSASHSELDTGAPS